MLFARGTMEFSWVNPLLIFQNSHAFSYDQPNKIIHRTLLILTSTLETIKWESWPSKMNFVSFVQVIVF
jgi:hypothetical protein